MGVSGTSMADYRVHLLPEPAPHRLVIAFAGGPQNFYQFGQSLRELGVSHILMRDSTQRYHGFGVEGIGDREAVLNYIRRFVSEGWHVITTGVSSGAYAALLYGQLAPVHEVIAISPLSGRELDDFHPSYHGIIYDPNQADMDDLRKYFPHGPVPKVRAFISDRYPSCTLDGQMATRIGLHDITMIPGYEHGDLARLGMRDKGLFRSLFLGD